MGYDAAFVKFFCQKTAILGLLSPICRKYCSFLPFFAYIYDDIV